MGLTTKSVRGLLSFEFFLLTRVARFPRVGIPGPSAGVLVPPVRLFSSGRAFPDSRWTSSPTPLSVRLVFMSLFVARFCGPGIWSND